MIFIFISVDSILMLTHLFKYFNKLKRKKNLFIIVHDSQKFGTQHVLYFIFFKIDIPLIEHIHSYLTIFPLIPSQGLEFVSGNSQFVSSCQCECGWSSLCGPVWWLVQVVTPPLPQDSWDRVQPLHDLCYASRRMDGWMVYHNKVISGHLHDVQV